MQRIYNFVIAFTLAIHSVFSYSDPINEVLIEGAYFGVEDFFIYHDLDRVTVKNSVISELPNSYIPAWHGVAAVNIQNSDIPRGLQTYGTNQLNIADSNLSQLTAWGSENLDSETCSSCIYLGDYRIEDSRIEDYLDIRSSSTYIENVYSNWALIDSDKEINLLNSEGSFNLRSWDLTVQGLTGGPDDYLFLGSRNSKLTDINTSHFELHTGGKSDIENVKVNSFVYNGNNFRSFSEVSDDYLAIKNLQADTVELLESDIGDISVNTVVARDFLGYFSNSHSQIDPRTVSISNIEAENTELTVANANSTVINNVTTNKFALEQYGEESLLKNISAQSASITSNAGKLTLEDFNSKNTSVTIGDSKLEVLSGNFEGSTSFLNNYLYGDSEFSIYGGQFDGSSLQIDFSQTSIFGGLFEDLLLNEDFLGLEGTTTLYGSNWSLNGESLGLTNGMADLTNFSGILAGTLLDGSAFQAEIFDGWNDSISAQLMVVQAVPLPPTFWALFAPTALLILLRRRYSAKNSSTQ